MTLLLPCWRKKKRPPPDPLEFVHPPMKRGYYSPNRKAAGIRGDYAHKVPSTVPATGQCLRAVGFPTSMSCRAVLKLTLQDMSAQESSVLLLHSRHCDYARDRHNMLPSWSFPSNEKLTLWVTPFKPGSNAGRHMSHVSLHPVRLTVQSGQRCQENKDFVVRERLRKSQ